MSAVQLVSVDADGEGQRLDRWFRRRFPQVNQIRIEKMCRKGEIRVDGARVRAASRLEEGQSVRIPPLPDAGDRAVPQEISSADAQMIRDCVIFRDDHILALNKPAGLAVQGGSRQFRHVDGLSEALRFGAAEKPRLVHRLDKDTSGVLLLARSAPMAAGLARAFQARAARKIYWALVASVPAPREGVIETGLLKAPGHGPHGAGEKMVCIHPDAVPGTPGAKRATTDYVVLEAAAKRAAWVALSPITGRTHQLRAHMAEIGTPIVGDGKYGSNRQTNEGEGWGAQLGGDISRKMHLHARSLSLKHPKTGAVLHFVAPLPDHMARSWDIFGWQASDAPSDPFLKADK